MLLPGMVTYITHVKKVDTTLNSCLRIVTGATQSSPIPWLSVLANIDPPDIRRKITLEREYTKIVENSDLPIHDDIDNRVGTRLISRNKLWLKTSQMNNFRNMNGDESGTTLRTHHGLMMQPYAEQIEPSY
ncbi:hypothetical protein HA402_008195 [Bradysia odoriphaga]|nr:hypothetical protein HA402_008195 [Bradysia odoriphaga]